MHLDFPIRVLRFALVMTIIACWSESLLSQVTQDDYKNWPAGIEARKDLSQERSYDYDFSRISVKTLKTWLGRIGVKIPVDLGGELSGWVWAQRSEKGWLDFSNYKLEGEIRSRELKIDDWLVKDGRVRFGYAGGNWYIGKISGELKSIHVESPIGIADARAKILTASNSNVVINAKIDSIDLKSLLRSFGLEFDIQNSGGSVSLDGVVPIASASDLSKWNASSKVAVDDVVLPWIKSRGKAFAELKLAKSKWTVTDGRIKVAEQDLTIAGTGMLKADLPFAISIVGREIDASQLLQQLKNPALANQLDGSIQLTGKVAGDQSNGISQATATVESASLNFRSQPIENLKVVADYTPAGIRLDIPAAELAGGTATGFAKWQDLNELVRGVPSGVDFKIQSVRLEDLVVVELPVRIGGLASGVLAFGTEKRGELDDWNSTGQLQIDGLRAAGTNFGKVDVAWKKEPTSNELIGNVNVKQGSGLASSNVVVEFDSETDATIRATTLNRYRAEGQLKDYDLVARIGSDSSDIIPMQVLGSFKISGSPNGWLERGEAKFSNSRAKIGDRMLRLDWADVSFNESEYRVERFRLVDLDGRIVGAASFKRDNIGEHLLRLRVVDVPLNPYLELIAPKSLNSLDGVAAIECELRKDAANKDIMSDWTGRISGSLSSLNFSGKPIGELNFNGEIDSHLLTANVDGELVGGTAIATLELPLSMLEENSMPSSTPAKMEIKIAKIQAQRLAGFLFEGQFAKDIVGSLSIELAAEATSSTDFVIDGKLEIPLVKHKSNALARELTANLRFSENRLYLERFSGGFAGGRIDAQGVLELDQDDHSALSGGRVKFVAQRLDANNLVSIFYPEYAKYYEGSFDYRGTAVYRRGIQLNGSANVTNGKLFGIPIQVARGKVRTELTKQGEFSRVVSRDLHGTAFGGILNAELDIRGGTEYSLKTSGRISRGKLDQLSRAIGFKNIVGSGVFNGNFDLNSSRIESVRALTGGLQVDFENGDVKSIPLLSSIDRFVPLAQFASTNIENGRLSARVGQGQMRISDLIISSRAFLLAANGNATLDGSKLDLEVVVQTGGSIQQQLTQSAIENLVLGTVPQVAAVNELNELIRNRSVFLHVAGSASRPVITPKPAQTAAKAFVENAARRYLGAIPDTKQ